MESMNRIARKSKTEYKILNLSALLYKKICNRLSQTEEIKVKKRIFRHHDDPTLSRVSDGSSTTFI